MIIIRMIVRNRRALAEGVMGSYSSTLKSPFIYLSVGGHESPSFVPLFLIVLIPGGEDGFKHDMPKFYCER